ncbi:MAG: ROK family protein, partial [Thermoguttaceae bacterium]|nr:ROK family protein [Thermoguttaceae bacterium]
QQQEIPKILFEEASAGDALSLRIIDETAFYLALGLVSIVNTVDPSCILIGGAMTFGGKETELGRNFLQTIDRQFRQRTFSYLAERIRIDYAQLGPDAGFIGAAGLAKHAEETKNKPEPSISPVKREPVKQTKRRKPKSGRK